MGHRLVLAVIAVAVAARPAVAHNEGCPEARRRMRDGAGAAAETAARACVAAAPDDVAAWVVLAQALTAGGRHAEALRWLDGAFARFPEDADIAAMRARSLAFDGRLDEAWAAFGALSVEAQSERDNAVFTANLALWRKDTAGALSRFEEAVHRWPEDHEALRGRGLARQAAGDLAGAQADFVAVCRVDAAGPGCAWAEAAAERRSRFRLRVAPAYALVEERGDGWNIATEIELRATQQLRLSVSADRRTRDFGAGPIGDTYVEGTLSWRLAARAAVTAAAGAGIGRRFSPQWTAQIEPSVGIGGGLELFLKYWRIDFPAQGAHVISPAVYGDWEPWTAYLRYFFALPEGAGIQHAVFARITRRIGDHWTGSGGGGAGTGFDYLELHDGESGRFWFALAGLAYRPGWRHRVSLDYLRRSERAGDASFTQHTLSLAYEVRL